MGVQKCTTIPLLDIGDCSFQKPRVRGAPKGQPQPTT